MYLKYTVADELKKYIISVLNIVKTEYTQILSVSLHHIARAFYAYFLFLYSTFYHNYFIDFLFSF